MKLLQFLFGFLLGHFIVHYAYAQCANGYTQNNSVFACQQNAPPPPPPPPPPPTTFNIGYTVAPTGGSITDTVSTIAGSGPFTMTANGTLQSISMYIGVPAGASEYFGVFADNAGAPGALIAQTTLHVMVAGWNTFNSSTAPSISNGSKIWIMKLPPTGTATGSSPSDSTAAGYTWIGGAASVFPATLIGLPQHPYSNLTFGGYATFH